MNDNESDVYQLDVEAHLNLYRLVSMEVTCGQVPNIEAGQIPGRAPIRQFARITGLPTANWQAAVRSNSDLKCATNCVTRGCVNRSFGVVTCRLVLRLNC